jgi:hypothetical protein
MTRNQPRFDLGDAIRDLINEIATGRAVLHSSEAEVVFTEWASACKQYYSATKELSELAGRYPTGSDLLTQKRIEVDDLAKQLSEAYRAYDDLTSLIFHFENHLRLFMDRLPNDADCQHFPQSIEGLRFGLLSAWTCPDENPDLDTLEMRLRGMIDKPPTRNVRIRPLDVGDAKWSDLHIKLLSEQQLQVFVKGQARAPITFQEAGFADGRSREVAKPNSAWSVLLDFARSGGALNRPPMAHSDRARATFEKRVEEIRERFKELFRLPSDPFHPLDGDCYRLIPKLSSCEIRDE